MSGLPLDVCLAICRMEAQFADDNGTPRSVTGTGYWMFSPCGKTVFVTNKHNLDLGFCNFSDKNFKLKKIGIELRDFSVDKYRPIPKMFFLSSYEPILSTNADVAILHNITFKEQLGNFGFRNLQAKTWLADSSIFDQYYGIAQEVFFLGFPHGKYDEEGNLPIASHAIFSSIPNRSFKNKFIKTDDIILVDGRSFKGSSGSPVFTFPRGLFIGTDKGGPINSDGYCPQKIVGIMSGHLYQEGKWISDFDQKREDFLNHSGKSYFTRSTSILELFNKLTLQAPNSTITKKL
jgi:hypothetical protein